MPTSAKADRMSEREREGKGTGTNSRADLFSGMSWDLFTPIHLPNAGNFLQLFTLRGDLTSVGNT